VSDIDKRFHETWLGMIQPSEGLVVSIPALLEAQCLERQPAQVQQQLQLLSKFGEGKDAACVADLKALFATVLDLDAERFDEAAALPEDLQLYVPEGRQTLRPTMALRAGAAATNVGVDPGPAARAGQGYSLLVWQLPLGLKLDRPETVTGPWEYPPGAKFDRLLRACRVPIGLLSNGQELRLYYAPHGESTGWISFRVEDMCTVGGRPILDAFCMLLSRQRWFGVAVERQLPAILEDSRRKQAGVTNQLADQVFSAMEDLLRGFAGAADRDGDSWLREVLSREGDHLYGGLLTTLLRLVFVLYCEDRSLLPVESKLYSDHFSLLGLFDQLQNDHALYPDSMSRRFGAYGRLVSLFRAVFDGAQHGDLNMPPRRGGLFDPNAYPFLEGWTAGSAPRSPEDRTGVRVPTVDDLTVYLVLEKLLLLDGQRLSYQTLDVEQIGSVYEALMGFSVCRLESGAVRLRIGNKKGAARVWVESGPLFAQAAGQRGRWLQDEYGFDNATSAKIAKGVGGCVDEAGVLAVLEGLGGKRPELARSGGLVVQPGPERRRTSSHYTPRSLTEPIVARTLDPLIKTIGEEPGSEALLSLVICDPAMGSGAFLVAACRYLADHVVAAWTRENRLEKIADAHDDVVNHARRLVAQRCLYGVDKNAYAVQLARLSLWLVTMARNEPFTFVDHALRHGDSLVGLDFDQIRAFHWAPGKQVDSTELALREALNEAVQIRKQILDLAGEGSLEAQRAKERLLFDAQDALDRVRLIGDVVVGAFFAEDNAKGREKERVRRLDLVQRWLVGGDDDAEAELRGLQVALREECKPAVVPFHWMVEFPEVFYAERPDPLNGGKITGGAYVDGFVGNPPFAGKNGISETNGPLYLSWLQVVHEGAHGNADLSAHFFRRAASLLGKHGTLGLIATNTIGQGDTRATGLQWLVKNGFGLYGAEVDMKWPGDAAVTVSVVHAVRGNPAAHAVFRLNGVVVGEINSECGLEFSGKHCAWHGVHVDAGGA
jgi:hypothetical protein